MRRILGSSSVAAVVVALCSAAPGRRADLRRLRMNAPPRTCARTACAWARRAAADRATTATCAPAPTRARPASARARRSAAVTCDDGNPCTTNDTCASGICQGTAVANNTPCGAAARRVRPVHGRRSASPTPRSRAALHRRDRSVHRERCLLGDVLPGTYRPVPIPTRTRARSSSATPRTASARLGSTAVRPLRNVRHAETGQCADANEGLPCDD